MNFVIPLIFLAIVAYYLTTMYRDYAATPGSTWDRLLAAGKGSATKLWAKIVGILSAGLGGLASSAEVLNAPQISAAIQAYAKPEWVAGIMLGIMVVTELARGRTLEK